MEDKLISYIKELEIIVLSAYRKLPSSREDVQYLLDSERNE